MLGPGGGERAALAFGEAHPHRDASLEVELALDPVDVATLSKSQIGQPSQTVKSWTTLPEQVLLLTLPVVGPVSGTLTAPVKKDPCISRSLGVGSNLTTKRRNTRKLV